MNKFYFTKLEMTYDSTHSKKEVFHIPEQEPHH